MLVSASRPAMELIKPCEKQIIHKEGQTIFVTYQTMRSCNVSHVPSLRSNCYAGYPGEERKWIRRQLHQSPAEET